MLRTVGCNNVSARLKAMLGGSLPAEAFNFSVFGFWV